MHTSLCFLPNKGNWSQYQPRPNQSETIDNKKAPGFEMNQTVRKKCYAEKLEGRSVKPLKLRDMNLPESLQPQHSFRISSDKILLRKEIKAFTYPSTYPTAKMQKIADIEEKKGKCFIQNDFIFQGNDFERAIKTGVFVIDLPKYLNLFDLEQCTASLEQSTSAFRKSDKEITTVFLDAVAWTKIANTRKVVNSLYDLALQVLEFSFVKIGIPRDQWNKASSGIFSTDDHLLEVNFDKEMDAISHKSFITIRHMGNSNGSLAVHFGEAMQALTSNAPVKIKASVYSENPMMGGKMNPSLKIHLLPPTEAGMIWSFDGEKLHPKCYSERFFETK